MEKLLFIAILVACSLKCSAWDFEYSYLNVLAPQADDNIEGETNFLQFGSADGLSGWVAEGLHGKLDQHFEFPSAMSEVYLRLNVRTDSVGGNDYRYPSVRITASKDNFETGVLLASYSHYPNEPAKTFLYDGYLPAELVGAPDLWLRVETSLRVGGMIIPTYNTYAIFSSSTPSVTTPVFELKANAVPEPNTATLLGMAGIILMTIGRNIGHSRRRDVR